MAMSEKITFKELVEQISSESDQSQNSTNSFIHELVQIIESGLHTSGSVSISGFGKFELRWMKERRGRHPQTGDEITIPGQNKVVFKPYKPLREGVNKPFASMKAKLLKDAGTAATGANTTEDPLLLERSRPAGDEPAEVSPRNSGLDKQLDAASIIPPSGEAELARQVEKSGTMKWAYAASTIIVAMAVLAVLYFTQKNDEPATITHEAASEEKIESVQRPLQTAIMGVESLEEQQSPAKDIETDTDDTSTEETSFEVYTVQPGETLWSIAEKKLGDPYLWPWIYNLNEHSLDNPNHLVNNTELTLPTLSNPQDLSSDERDQIASGYLSIYNWIQTNQPDEAKFFLWAVGEFSTEILEQASQRVDSGDLAFAKVR